MAVDNFSVLPPSCFLLHVVAGIANWGGPEAFWRRKLCGFWVLRKPWKKICGWRRSIALFGNRGCLESLLWRFFGLTKVAFLSCRHELTLTSHAEKLAQQYGDLLVFGCYCRKAAWAWMPVRMGCTLSIVYWIQSIVSPGFFIDFFWTLKYWFHWKVSVWFFLFSLLIFWIEYFIAFFFEFSIDFHFDFSFENIDFHSDFSFENIDFWFFFFCMQMMMVLIHVFMNAHEWILYPCSFL